MYHWSVYSLAYATAALVALVATVLAWRRRNLPAARYLALALFAILWWSAAIVFESAATTIAGKLLWSQIAYIGTTAAPLCYLLLAAAYTRHREWLRPRVIALLALPPLATTLVAFTNPSHGWLWREILIQPRTNLAIYVRGPWFTVGAVHAYIYLGLGASLFLRHMDQVGASRRRISALLLAAALPLLANLLYLSQINPVPGLDWTVLGFVASGVAMTWAVLRLGLLEALPVARAQIVEMMDAAVLVIDGHGRVLDANPALARLVGTSPDQLIGQGTPTVLAGAPELAQWLARADSGVTEAVWETALGPRRCEAQLARLPDEMVDGGLSILIIHDRTALAQARQQVEMLEGLLPICARCKRIRDDQGYWRTVEAYLESHRGIMFTHGLCPTCLEKLCPEQEGDAPCE